MEEKRLEHGVLAAMHPAGGATTIPHATKMLPHAHGCMYIMPYHAQPLFVFLQ